MFMLCRMLREAGVADIVENASLRLHIISLHKFTHVYIYFSENCRSRFDIKCFHLFTHIHNGIVRTVGRNCT